MDKHWIQAEVKGTREEVERFIGDASISRMLNTSDNEEGNMIEIATIEWWHREDTDPPYYPEPIHDMPADPDMLSDS